MFIIPALFIPLLNKIYHHVISLYRYSISDFLDEKKYVVNVKITVCLELSGPCLVKWDVFNDMYLPKLGCDWQINFSGKY